MSATICVPVTDLRREPIPAKCSYERDFLQETQLLYGEKVLVCEEKMGWCRVEALQQPKFLPSGRWGGYPGWVQSAHLLMGQAKTNAIIDSQWAPLRLQCNLQNPIVYSLPFGACCNVFKAAPSWLEVHLLDGRCLYMPKKPKKTLLQKAAGFIGHPYLWGGCSPYSGTWQSCRTGIDCSALVHLLYRSIGIKIPRDARDQYRLAKVVEKPLRGDLLFRADPASPEKVDHVMLVEDEERLLEACLEFGGMRRIAVKDKFGASLSSLYNNKTLSGHVVSIGRIESGRN